MGTPDFAVPSLEAIVSAGHEVVGVVTQPDRARNRGVVSYCPVKSKAIELGLKVFQYEKIRLEGKDELRALGADVMVTCAYGQILDEELLSLAPFGVLNVHASLLPKYRGSSPIQWAVINGEKVTGITVMKTALGVDTGDIMLQKEVAILPDETGDRRGARARRERKCAFYAAGRVAGDLVSDVYERQRKNRFFKVCRRARQFHPRYKSVAVGFLQAGRKAVQNMEGEKAGRGRTFDPQILCCRRDGDLFRKAVRRVRQRRISRFARSTARGRQAHDRGRIHARTQRSERSHARK